MRIQNSSRWIICLICLGICAPQVFAAPAGRAPDIAYFPEDSSSKYQDYVPDELLVRFRNGPVTPEHQQTLDALGAQIAEISPKSGWARIRFPGGPLQRTHEHLTDSQLEAIRQQLVSDQIAEQVERNPVARGFATPSDPYWRLQWNLHSPGNGGVNLERAWEIAAGEGVKIAILDTGLAYEDYGQYLMASDLAQTRILPGRDLVNGDDHPNDDHGHGTHVAGTIAQSTDNGLGVAGIAPAATLMPVKVLDADANGDYFTISEGIYYAVDHGADVINLSLGGPWNALVLQEAIQYAHQKGVTVIAAAGNEYQSGNPLIFPAAYDECIAVGASTYEKERAVYSSTGSHLDVVAPGGDTTVDRNRDGYGDGVLQQTISRSSFKSLFYYSEGTSMAAPHVSGIVALLISKGVRSPDTIRDVLTATAHDIGRSGWDSETGAGLVDAYAALTYQTPDAGPDIEVTEMQVSGEVAPNATVPIILKLHARDLLSQRLLLSVHLHDEETGRTPVTQRLWVSDGESSELRMEWTAPSEGEYTLSASIDAVSGEIDTANNTASVRVKVASAQQSHQGTSLYATIQQRSIIEQNYWEVLLDVVVCDEFEQPVSSAEVVIDWSYDSRIERTTALSDAEGRAEIRSGRLSRWASPTYYKRAVVKEGYQFGGFVASSAQVGRGDADEGATVRPPDPMELGRNYPNPFNPETWIPFRLGIASPVAVNIYDTRGAPIRRIDLGYLPPGRYDSRETSAYWDGRNSRGEQVASGVYYYTLRAGDFSATRKMVITR